MKIKVLFVKSLLALGAFYFVSCSSDKSEELPQLPKGNYENGILISGEGSGAGSGSVYFVPNDLSEAKARIFNTVNSEELGTFLQSMAFDNDNAYVIVDNQKTITVVNRYTFKKLNTITDGLTKPRYMTVANGKAYVTDWGEGAYGNDNTEDDYVAVIDLSSLEATKIAVQAGPERIVERDGKIYVSHKGGFGSNNKVSVINTATNAVEKVIEVNDNPDELEFDTNGNLIVLCSGKAAWTGNETSGAISKINVSDYSVNTVEFPQGSHPSEMTLENNTIYYTVGSNVYKVSSDATTLPTSEIFSVELYDKADGYSSLYGLAVRDNQIFTLISRFKDVSKLEVFDATTNKKTNTLEAPIGASKIYFN